MAFDSDRHRARPTHARARRDRRPGQTRGVAAPRRQNRGRRSESRSRAWRCSSNACILASGTKIARIEPCRGLSENSPRSSRASTWRTVSRRLRPTSSFLPCSDSVGIADELSTRRITDWPPTAASSSARPSLSSASLPDGAFTRSRPWNRQNRSSTAVYLHARRTAAAFLRCDKAFDKDQRNGIAERARELFPEESLSHNDAIGSAQPLQDEVAEACADRDAHHQRTGQHRDRNGYAADNSEIRTPVMTKASAPQSAGFHRSQATRCSFRSTRSKRMGNRAARSALCVTTIRIACCFCCSSKQQRRDRFGRSPIEIARRLVAQQEQGTTDQRASQCHALLLAAGQLARKVCDAVRKSDLVDQQGARARRRRNQPALRALERARSR